MQLVKNIVTLKDTFILKYWFIKNELYVLCNNQNIIINYTCLMILCEKKNVYKVFNASVFFFICLQHFFSESDNIRLTSMSRKKTNEKINNNNDRSVFFYPMCTMFGPKQTKRSFTYAFNFI